MGFFDRIRDFFSDAFGGGDEPPTMGVSGDPFEGPPRDPMSEGLEDYTGPDDKFAWQLAGQVPAGQSYADGYVNYDPDSPGDRYSVTPFAGWDFLPHADMVVVKVTTGGNTYYVTLGGPFNDWEDLYDAIADWWESGS